MLESLTVRAGAVQGAEAGAAEEQESDDEGWSAMLTPTSSPAEVNTTTWQTTALAALRFHTDGAVLANRTVPRT